MDSYTAKAIENLEKVREQKPLIHNITNYVVMNFTANVLLAMGASPVMAHAPNEVKDMAAIAGSLVLNIGTLSDHWIEAMIEAGRTAAEYQKPVVLDPVGAGATAYRTTTAKRIISETAVSVIRGNASEILSLGGEASGTKGVDSLHSVDDAAAVGRALAGELKTTLAITGAVDLVTDGEQVLRVSNGHALMPYITGSGCAATSIIGAFLAVDRNPVTATASALAFFGSAGEKAAESANAPGSFLVALLDSLYTLSTDELGQRCRIMEN